MLIDTTASTGIPSDSRSLPFARMRQFGTFATSVFPSYRLTCIVGFVSLNWCYFTSSEMCKQSTYGVGSFASSTGEVNQKQNLAMPLLGTFELKVLVLGHKDLTQSGVLLLHQRWGGKRPESVNAHFRFDVTHTSLYKKKEKGFILPYASFLFTYTY